MWILVYHVNEIIGKLINYLFLKKNAKFLTSIDVYTYVMLRSFSVDIYRIFTEKMGHVSSVLSRVFSLRALRPDAGVTLWLSLPRMERRWRGVRYSWWWMPWGFHESPGGLVPTIRRTNTLSWWDVSKTFPPLTRTLFGRTRRFVPGRPSCPPSSVRGCSRPGTPCPPTIRGSRPVGRCPGPVPWSRCVLKLPGSLGCCLPK